MGREGYLGALTGSTGAPRSGHDVRRLDDLQIGRDPREGDQRQEHDRDDQGVDEASVHQAGPARITSGVDASVRLPTVRAQESCRKGDRGRKNRASRRLRPIGARFTLVGVLE